MEQVSRVFADAVRASLRQIRTAIGTATTNPSLLTASQDGVAWLYPKPKEDPMTEDMPADPWRC